MTTSIKYIKDKEDNNTFPITHERAVRDSNGTTLETKLQIIDERLGKGSVKIFGIGNSWTRDMMRYVAGTLESLGYDVIVGQAYLGGSTLQDQYYGIDDTTYSYSHSGNQQVVHSTYQYWKYDNNETPVLDPATGYNNGAAGIGVTLQSCIEDEPWDYIVFMPSIVNAGDYNAFTNDDKSNYQIDIKDFVSKVKEWCTNPDVKFGWSIPWSYASGSTSTLSQTFLNTYNDGNTPSTQDEKNALFESAHEQVQRVSIDIAGYMGNDCNFILNPGLAIHNARANNVLDDYGYKLQRAVDNTHLASGLPMYVASLCVAYELNLIDRREIEYYPTAASENSVSPTVYAANQARRVSWNAQMNWLY